MAESTSSGASTEPATSSRASAGPFGKKARLLLAVLGLAVAAALLLWLRPFSPSAQQLGAWQPDLSTALELSREHARPLHVYFSSPDAPLATRMDETLSLEPVQQLARAHFVNVRLDARAQAELFRRLVGSAGALASCVVDHDAAGELDVVAVAAGYLDPERYVAFLDAAWQGLPRLRELRDGKRQDATTLLALGELYAAQGSVARARSTFSRVSDEASRALALERLARLDVEAGHTAQARRELEEAKSRGGTPGSARIWLTEALILSSAGSATPRRCWSAGCRAYRSRSSAPVVCCCSRS